ncbi:hypothetical protein O3M35_002841 [Rhynocoris fuscipes]|uniref:Uncharacterized protein n=1 Tax=Rhynocoris fuscipes TaxID=488301 RepID=A0AAW1CQA1_9HEMI
MGYRVMKGLIYFPNLSKPNGKFFDFLNFCFVFELLIKMKLMKILLKNIQGL